MTNDEREKLREDIETAMRPAVDEAIAIISAPYKRIPNSELERLFAEAYSRRSA